MNSKSSGEKKRVAHIGNLTNTCLQGESLLPSDDYVYSILESMNATLSNSEKKVITYQQLQEFRSSKNQAVLDDSGTGNLSSPSISQNDSSSSARKKKNILPPKVYPLMAKCQKNLKYLKHNRCIPKPRAHVGSGLQLPKEQASKKQDPFESKILNSNSKVKEKKSNFTKQKPKKQKISKESPEFSYSSSINKDFNKHPPNGVESGMESNDEFENFIQKHHTKKRKNPIYNFSSDSSDSSLEENITVKTTKRNRLSKKQAKTDTSKPQYALISSDLSQTRAVTKTIKKKSIRHVSSKKHSVKLQKDVTCSSDMSDNPLNDFDAFCNDDSLDSLNSNRDYSKSVNETVNVVTNDEKFSLLFDNVEKGNSLSCTNNAQASLKTNSKNPESQNIENYKLMLNCVVPCSVSLTRNSVVKETEVENSSDKSCVSNDSNYHKNSSTLSENPCASNVYCAQLTTVCNSDSNSDLAYNSKNAANIKDINSLDRDLILKTDSLELDLDECVVLSEDLVQSNNQIHRSSNGSKQSLLPSVKAHSLHKTLMSERSNESECNLGLKSCLNNPSLGTKLENMSNERSESESDDCLILDETVQENSGSPKMELHKSQFDKPHLGNDMKSLYEINNFDIVNESTNGIIQNCSEDLGFNVKILSVHSVSDLNSTSIINSPEDNVKEQLNTEVTSLSDYSKINFENLKIPPKKDETKYLLKPEISVPSDQQTEIVDNDISILKKGMPVQPMNHVLYDVDNDNCEFISESKLQRRNEQSNDQILKDADNSNKFEMNQDPKLIASNVTEKNENGNQHTSLVPDDCIIIEEKSSVSVTHKSNQFSRVNSACISDTNLTKELKPIKNLSHPSAVGKDTGDSSLSKNMSSIISDDCIVISDDESSFVTDNSLCHNSTSTKCSSADSSNKYLREEQKPDETLSESSIKNISDTHLPSTSTVTCDDCIIIDDNEFLSPTVSIKTDNSKLYETSQVKKNYNLGEVNKCDIDFQNSIQSDTSSIEVTKPLLTLNSSSSRFKPDLPNKQVLDALQRIDFEQIKKILSGLDEKNTNDCDTNSPVSSGAIDVNSKPLCQENESSEDVEEFPYVSKTKCHKNSLLPENIKSESNSCVIEGTSDSPIIIDEDESGRNLHSCTVSKSNCNWSRESSTNTDIHNSIKMESCSNVEAAEISNNIGQNKIELKRKQNELHLGKNLELNNVPVKLSDIPFSRNTQDSNNTLKTSTICGKQKLVINSIDVNNHPNFLSNQELPASETVKKEGSYENTSNELDAFAASSLQTLSDINIKQKNITHLIDLYREECKKYQEIKSTGRNLSAGLNLLREKQVEKLKHIQSSIKNILKYDPCFHKIVKDVKEKHQMQEQVPKLLEGKDDFQAPGPSYSNLKIKTEDISAVNQTFPKDCNIINPSVLEGAHKTVKSSHSTESTLSDKEIYERLMNSKCAQCGKPAVAACQGCFRMYFCSSECGMISWNKGHYATCGT